MQLISKSSGSCSHVLSGPVLVGVVRPANAAAALASIDLGVPAPKLVVVSHKAAPVLVDAVGRVDGLSELHHVRLAEP